VQATSWTTDDARALRFYEQVFGYSHDSMDMGPEGTYYMLKTGEVSRGGLMHSVRPDAPSMWLPYVAVADSHDVNLPQYDMVWSFTGRNAIQADYHISYTP